ncbi:MAG: UDP-N-acetylmuramoyl-L-alanine--D-glutamate ligase [Epsilonproteobacteria bacterium]|nr:UDP-N-acetylmuramoyl-L-alanine--D-glutamate ligase [Campylobacterota bacterium]
MRILGKGKTAQAIKDVYSDAIMYDDLDKGIYNIDSDELTVVSPGIPPYNYLVQNTKNLISEYDLICQDAPYTVWISGTNGKTTTTAMMEHILKYKNAISGGNIGLPLAKMDKTKNIWILETSSFTIHYTKKAKPNIYVLLPITEDHTSWHGSFEEYEKSKLKPLDSLCEGEIAIIPKKYESYPTNGFKICYENSDDLAAAFGIDKLKINFKEPFLMDALLAMSVDKILFDNVSYDTINSFIQDPHKMEEFRDKQNRLWVDDSKATNFDATLQALNRYIEKKIHIILGGDDKGVDLTPLFKELYKYNLEIYAIGTNCEKLYDLAIIYGIKCHKCYFLENSVKEISDNMKIGDNCDEIALLSPAAASLDQFISYKDRGEKFKQFVRL